MRQDSMARRHQATSRLGFLACLAAAALLFVPRPANAEDSGFHPLDSTLKMLNLKTDAGSMPDFVQQARPKSSGDYGYMPVGQKHPASPIKAKTPDQVKAAEAELDAAHDAQLGRRPKPAVSSKPAGKQSKIRPQPATDH